MTKKMLSIGILAALFLSACASLTRPGDTPAPTDIAPQAALAAEKALSESLGVPKDEIDLVSYEQEDWPDACLGLGGEDEMCAQVITPGWRIVLRADEREYVFRTDQSGDVVRREETD